MMVSRTPLHQEVDSLPDLVDAVIDPFAAAARAVFTPELCIPLRGVFLTGCGDSHHAAVNMVLAFQLLAGLPCQAMTAMQFARYTAGFLPPEQPGTSLVVAISVSGQVSRTVEALRFAGQRRATAVALTGNATGPLAQTTAHILHTAVPHFATDRPKLPVPGCRSYVASQLALALSAIQIGQSRGHLGKEAASRLRRELATVSQLMAQTISLADPITAEIATNWPVDSHLVFCGSGPNFGTALFSAAKVLEASGDPAVGQDLEEWSHLQYFSREAATPTFFISAALRDEDRAVEVVSAAKAIGRRVAIIAPQVSELAEHPDKDRFIPVAGPIRECFSPLVTSLPGILLAAYRAQATNEPYFRAFSGGRSRRGGGGVSRIRESHQLDGPPGSDSF
jgi:glutamine---fructose-6-phosphate transaminase (isomerizing)